FHRIHLPALSFRLGHQNGGLLIRDGQVIRPFLWTSLPPGFTLEINARSYSSIQSILKNGLESKPRTRATEEPAITHTNIRGAD
ncbi:hypothetical protein BV911_19230, partial [Pseudoruegeria sp. SK021]